MYTGKGRVVELMLADGCRYARLSCPEKLIPSAGQYLLAGHESDMPLPVSIFYTDSAPQGFITAAPDSWNPGDDLYLRGPLGRGFTLPTSARKIALIVFDDSPARLRGLIQSALRQQAAVALVCNSTADDLPDEVEVLPFSALDEILRWSDFVAVDVSRENLLGLRESLQMSNHLPAVKDAQVLIRTQMPCGGVAECGVCAVVTKSHWKMACKDGPVFAWRE